MSDTLGTIGFGALIGLGGVPCIANALINGEHAALLLGIPLVLFGLSWGIVTYRRAAAAWRFGRVQLDLAPHPPRAGQPLTHRVILTPNKTLPLLEIACRIRAVEYEPIQSRRGVYDLSQLRGRGKVYESTLVIARDATLRAGEAVTFEVTFAPGQGLPSPDSPHWQWDIETSVKPRQGAPHVVSRSFELAPPAPQLPAADAAPLESSAW